MPKKILHIIVKSQYDGVTSYSIRLIKSLPDYDHQLLSCYKGLAYNEINELNIPCDHLIDNGNISNWSVIIKYIRAISFFRKNRFDVIHYHHAGIGVLLIAVLFKKEANVIHHLHGGNLIGDHLKQDISLVHSLLLKQLAKYTQQVAVAEHVFREYISRIENTQNLSLIKNCTPYVFKKNNRIKNSVGYIGRFEANKGFFYFLKVSEQIRAFHKRIEIFAMGDEYIPKRYGINLIPVSFYINQFYQKIDLLIFASNATESLPLVVLEAISFDVGVIARPLKGVVEILGDNYPLYFQNEEELLSKVEYFYSHKFNRDSLSNLHQEGLKEFNFDEMIRKIDMLYKSD